ncbi:MAG TPA: ImmA/IrrE family metallo-endopeptidase [Pyrinomonadaceae bacterium]|nr:ImmA/IrrE family metallo-endopeptidase [Pyrinomonadaceae bacterium]
MNLSLTPKVLRWARERAGLDQSTLAKKVIGKPTAERVKEWEQTGVLTFVQARKLAHATHTPEGFLYLNEPPEDRLPIPDFRTVRDEPVRHPSPDLLDTVYMMQRRQTWMRDFLIEEGEAQLAFIGSSTLNSNPQRVAADIRKTLGIGDGWANEESTWTDALMRLRQKIEAAGILIVINGVVGNNNYRKLDPDEFRGFVLSDVYAPLVFINGADFKAAQMFTIAHEVAHLWINKDGVSNFEAMQPPPIPVEQWCNKVAAEFLVPAAELSKVWDHARQSKEPYQSLAARFKVSTIVAARRALDLDLISKKQFFDFYEAYQKDERRKKESKKNKGGDFWNTQNVRVGQRFGTAVVRAAKEGRLLYREAYQLTGLTGRTFDRFAENLGFKV